MVSQNLNIKQFFSSKEAVVLYVNGLLKESNQGGILQSITITLPEKSEDYYVTDATMFFSEGY